jgi:queuosine precursor transporter
MRAYRYLDILSVLFVVVLLVSNVAAVKALRLSGALGLDIDGGTLLFPLSYIFGDILVEVYGYARSRRVIWLGFASNAFAVLVFSLVVALPPSPDWQLQEAFAAVLGQTPRIVLASLIAFWVGEFSNSYIMAKMKIFTKGRRLWTRTIGSTIVGEGLDSLLFQAIAFGGVWPLDLILRVSLWNYILKVAYEVLATPATYAVVRALKRAEQEDYYDRGTNFNPFRLGV